MGDGRVSEGWRLVGSSGDGIRWYLGWSGCGGRGVHCTD
jgi:hypothetical protein